jgi:hypothetical protein
MSKPARQGKYDLDEVRPDLFVIGNPQVQLVLRGEGELSGSFFRLRSWRREGLIARLRERGFRARTLDERLDELPAVPAVTPPGVPLPRDIAGERMGYALFDPESLSWRGVESDPERGATTILLPRDAVVRRRKGRGGSSYFRVVEEQGRAGLSPLSEEEALLRSYAQAGAQGPRELRVSRVDKGFLLPKPAGLPPRHRAFIEALGEAGPEGVLAGERGWGLARKAYALLGLRAVLSDERTGKRKTALKRPPATKKRKGAPPDERGG